MASLNRVRTQYEAVASQLFTHFNDSPFWTALQVTLTDFHAAYVVRTSYPLLTTFSPPKLLIKSFDSFLLKTYRINVLTNTRWDEPPRGGWLAPDAWFSDINDIIRTTLVVRYLDGVQFLADSLQRAAPTHGMQATVVFQASEAGYYAAHVNIADQVSIPNITFDPITIQAHLEIQVTTQVKDLITRLLHEHYEAARTKVSAEFAGAPWQWDYRSTEFVASYLGHVLHYLEGMIVEVRDRQSSEKSSPTKLKEGPDNA